MLVDRMTDVHSRVCQVFVGQIVGTSVGTSVYNHYGWRASAGLSVGWQGFCILMLLVRGPHCPRYTWFGYKGGLSWRKPSTEEQPPIDAAGVEDEKQRNEDKKNTEDERIEEVQAVGREPRRAMDLVGPDEEEEIRNAVLRTSSQPVTPLS